MDESEVILSRVQKLLALATSNNVNESAAAAAKAQELLLKYNLSVEQVAGYTVDKAEPIIEQQQMFANSNIVEWKASLAFIVARNNLCRGFIQGNKFVWVGKDTNIQVARYLTDTLIADLERLARDYWNGILLLRQANLATGEAAYVHGRTWKSSFYRGAIDEIKVRLAESKRVLTTDSNMFALVVREDDALAEYLRKYNLRSRGTTSSSTNYSGYSSGREAGRSVSFKTGLGSGGANGTKLIGG
jgi:hypothetical protein